MLFTIFIANFVKGIRLYSSISYSSKATFIGFSTIIMWSSLVVLSSFTGAVPAFLLTAISKFIGTIPGIYILWRNPGLICAFRQPLKIWLIGVGGLFGYHFLFFTAIRSAPAAEVGLINYLWPLFIVVGSTFLPGEKLRWYHIMGAFLGFSGLILVLMGRGKLEFNASYNFGYFMAFAAALTWAVYSLASRYFKNVPTIMVTAFCFATAILSLICHFIFNEPTIWPQDIGEWTATLLLGLFPVGLAFYTWDYGIKHGNIQLLGTASYLTPLFSTLLLLLFGVAQFTWQLVVACILINLGAIIASKNLIFKSKEQKMPMQTKSIGEF